MEDPDQIRVREYAKVVSVAAWRFKNAAEYDDLYQEGMIAVWNCPPDASPQFVSKAVYNRMKDWVRFTKRLRHHQSVSYDEILEHDVRPADD